MIIKEPMCTLEKQMKNKKNIQGDAKGGVSIGQKSRFFLSKRK